MIKTNKKLDDMKTKREILEEIMPFEDLSEEKMRYVEEAMEVYASQEHIKAKKEGYKEGAIDFYDATKEDNEKTWNIMTKISEQSKRNVEAHTKAQVLNLSTMMNISYDQAVKRYKEIVKKLDNEYIDISFVEFLKRF